MRFDLKGLERRDPIFVRAGLERDMNNLDHSQPESWESTACRNTYWRGWQITQARPMLPIPSSEGVTQ